MNCFDLIRFASEELTPHLDGMRREFHRVSKREKSKKLAILKNAISIASQAIDSLRERHAYCWAAMKNGRICAVLIGDDKQRELVIRFLVADILNFDAKGAGKFLVGILLEIAKRSNRVVKTIAQNSEKYWKEVLLFQQDPSEPTQYIYYPNR